MKFAHQGRGISSATIATIRRDAGWSTFWIGKNHNVPVDAFDIGLAKKRWRWASATTASTASSAARRTSGTPS